MDIRVISSPDAPKAVEPYSPARSTLKGERWPEGSLVAMEAIAVI